MDNMYVIVGDVWGAFKFVSEQVYRVEKLETPSTWAPATPNENDLALTRMAGSEIVPGGQKVSILSIKPITNNGGDTGAPVLVAGFGNTVNTCKILLLNICSLN